MAALHLAIELTPESVRFNELSGSNAISSKVLDFAATDLSTKKEKLDAFFKENDLSQDKFENTTLSWSSTKSTLVPGNIFTESTPESILKLCFGDTIEKNDVDYNRFAALSLVNVYEIPDWIKRYFILKFPRIIIQHEGTHVLRKAMDSDTFYTKATLVLQNNAFLLVISKQNNLEFYSFFDYQSAEDVIYHLMFALQQKEMTGDRGTIELIEGNGISADSISAIKEGIAKIHDLSSFEVKSSADYISKAQLLCV